MSWVVVVPAHFLARKSWSGHSYQGRLWCKWSRARRDGIARPTHPRNDWERHRRQIYLSLSSNQSSWRLPLKTFGDRSFWNLVGRKKIWIEKFRGKSKIFIGFSMKISKIRNFRKNRKIEKSKIFHWKFSENRKSENRKSRFSIFDFSKIFDFLKISLKIQWRFFDFPIFRPKIQNDLAPRLLRGRK